MAGGQVFLVEEFDASGEFSSQGVSQLCGVGGYMGFVHVVEVRLLDRVGCNFSQHSETLAAPDPEEIGGRQSGGRCFSTVEDGIDQAGGYAFATGPFDPSPVEPSVRGRLASAVVTVRQVTGKFA